MSSELIQDPNNPLDLATRSQNQAEVPPRTQPSSYMKGFFYKATNLVINGGTYSVVAGDVYNYVGSTHNERSGNSKVANTTGSYNDSSTRVRREHTRSELRAVEVAGHVPCMFNGEDRELGTGRTVSGDETKEMSLQERRRRLEEAALRRIAGGRNHGDTSSGVAQQDQPADASQPNGDADRGSVSLPPSDSSSASSQSDLSDTDWDTDTDEEILPTTKTQCAKTRTKDKGVHDVSTHIKAQQSFPGFSASNPIVSQSPTSNINMQNPFGVLQPQIPHPFVAHQHTQMPLPYVLGHSFIPGNVPPSFPHPYTRLDVNRQSPLRPISSLSVNSDLHPYRKSRNPFAQMPTPTFGNGARERDRREGKTKTQREWSNVHDKRESWESVYGAGI